MSKNSFNYNLPLTADLCELVGSYIGDGCASRYGFMVQFSGDTKLDKHYFLNFHIPIISLYAPLLSYRLHNVKNSLRLTIYSKDFFSFFTKRLGFPIGPKTKTVKIPDVILKNESFTKACLRGIFDTDGSIYFDKRAIYAKPYPRIELHMVSKDLLKQVHELLL